MGGLAYWRGIGGTVFSDPYDGCEGPQPSKPLWTNIGRISGRQSLGAAESHSDIVGVHIGSEGRDGLRAVRLVFFFFSWQGRALSMALSRPITLR
jgi:hypothetical protein